MKFATWNVRSLNTGCFQTVIEDLEKYGIMIAAIQEVSWPNEDSLRSGKFTFFYGGAGDTRNLGTGFFVHESILSAVKDLRFVNNRISYIVLRSAWYDIVFLNVHGPTEDKDNDVKNGFYEEL
jgi:exonuclease III